MDRLRRLDSLAGGVEVIELKDIAKTYQMGEVQVHALRGVTLAIAAGEWVSVMGPSGSGKSTLMHIIGCLDKPTAGSYRLNGVEVGTMSAGQLAVVRNHQIGFVFQAFNLLPRTSALKQVMLPLRYSRDGARIPLAERRSRAMRALEAVGLADRAKHRPAELSGGQQQRVAIARALVTNPQIIMADEPTGNLDSHSGEEVMEILRTMHREKRITLIIVTHDEQISAEAQRIIHLHDGLVVGDTSQAQLERLKGSGA